MFACNNQNDALIRAVADAAGRGLRVLGVAAVSVATKESWVGVIYTVYMSENIVKMTHCGFIFFVGSYYDFLYMLLVTFLMSRATCIACITSIFDLLYAGVRAAEVHKASHNPVSSGLRLCGDPFAGSQVRRTDREGTTRGVHGVTVAFATNVAHTRILVTWVLRVTIYITCLQF